MAKNQKNQIFDIFFNEMDYVVKENQNLHHLFPVKSDSYIHWIDIDGYPAIESLEKLSKELSLHPLVLEDIATLEERPTIEDHGNIIFIVLSAIGINDDTRDLEIEQISIILGDNYVLSIQEKGEDIFNAIKERIEFNRGRIRRMGSDYLAYALIDVITDNYFGVLEDLGDNIESLEEELVSNPTANTL